MCTSNFEKNMDIAVKSAVQALDPACGLWLSAKVVDRKDEQFQVQWVFYNTTDWLHQSKVRKPIKKRAYVTNTSDWRTREPTKFQKGETVTIKKADGTSGDNVLIEENDPFECVVSKFNFLSEINAYCIRRSLYANVLGVRIYAGKRRLKYEWLMETPEDGEAEQETRLPFRSLPLVSNKSPEPPARKSVKKRSQAKRQTPTSVSRTSPESPPRQDDASEIMPTPATKKIRRNKTQSTKTASVQKKLTTRITVVDAPPSDDGRDDLPPYADGLEDQATIAIETVVANAQAEGNSIQLPAEWKNATPPFSCSAVCDSKIAQLQERVQYLENAVAMLRAAMEDKENQQPVEPAYFAAAPLPPSPPAASLSRVIGDAMGVVADEPIPTTPQAHEQITDPREMPAPSTNSLSLILMECGHDRTQLARRLLENFFSTQERLSCNTSGTRGKRQLDTDKLAEVRRLIFSYAPVSSPQAESTEWKRLKTMMDLANRHLRQSLKERCT
ncbi:hypothetical protein HOLleu_34126 [Holothuria leucospilota]|uniref:BEN domain-containing protein n=1 Tax=Holothuria leucospilota TaxID=206669 RepID=A0A9Q1BH46_HOLLE|nr:hypothetical protein HOLleu_34126 [Holothuria leucospilota]